MAKIFDWLKPTGNPSVNGYDLSQRRTFSMPCGYLNVCYSRMFIPRTKVEMSLRSIINTLPMVNQGFTRGQFLVDVYQVPYSMLYRNFNEFYAQANELFSSQDYDQSLQEYPLPSDIAHANYFGLLWYLLHDMIAIFRDVYGSSTSSERPSWSDFENACARYRKVYDWQTNNLLLGFDVHGIPVVLGALRILNMTGYGNWYLIFKDFFVTGCYKNEFRDPDALVRKFFIQQWVRSFYKFNGESKTEGDLEDQLTAAMTYLHETMEQEWITFDRHEAFISTSWKNFINALVGVLNNEDVAQVYAPETAATVEKIMSHQFYVSFFPVLAYQKIFADIYRNTFYDSVPAYAFNIDDLFADGSRRYLFEDDDLEPRYNQMLQSRYRQFKNDLFTCLLPSSQLGDVSMVQAGDSLYNIKLDAQLETTQNVGVRSVNNNLYATESGEVFENWKLSPTPAFSVLVQRRAEALQKYKERYLRAGNRLKDQFISTFGKVPYYLDDKYCRYIGSMHSDLNLQAVPATNDTGNYDVGERASYGYSGCVDKVSFNIDDFSIVMALCYYMPEADYESFQLDEEHTYSEPFDFPVPEFENIGLHSLTRFSLSVLGTPYNSSSGGGLDTYEGIFDGNIVNGFGPAWLGMKTDVDRLYGEFGSTPSLRGEFHTWVTSRGNVSMHALGDYYICPDYLNSIMVRQQNSNIPSQDQLLCCFDWNIKVVQPLTVVGLPVWD